MGKKNRVKRVKMSKLDRAIFLHHGKAFEEYSQDEFHKHYETIDVTQIREAEMEHHVEMPESIKLLVRTKGKPTLEQWSAVTGYKIPTQEEAFEAELDGPEQRVVVAEELSADDAAEMWGATTQTSTLGGMPAIEQVSPLSPVPVAWTEYSVDQLKAFSPLAFLAGSSSSAGADELDLALGPLLSKARSPAKWQRELSRLALRDFHRTVQVLSPANTQLCYYLAVSHSLFIVLLLQQTDGLLLNYFVLPPEEESANQQQH